MSETINESIMTLESIEGYISYEISKGANANIRCERLSPGTVERCSRILDRNKGVV